MRPSLSLIPISKRWSFLYADCGYIEQDGWSVVWRQGDHLTHLPVGQTSCLMLGPGTVITHEAIKACAEEGTLVLWVGEHGVRCYSAGMPGGASAERILHQASLRLDHKSHLEVARRLYRVMFKEEPPAGRGVDELRGIEGNRVKKFYADAARRHGVKWAGRRYDVQDFDASDAANRAISVATTTLYALSEAVILALGFAPSIGFIHNGHARSFVFDVADTIKLECAVETAFAVLARQPSDLTSAVRQACRDAFREQSVAQRLVTVVEDALLL